MIFKEKNIYFVTTNVTFFRNENLDLFMKRNEPIILAIRIILVITH